MRNESRRARQRCSSARKPLCSHTEGMRWHSWRALFIEMLSRKSCGIHFKYINLVFDLVGALWTHYCFIMVVIIIIFFFFDKPKDFLKCQTVYIILENNPMWFDYSFVNVCLKILFCKYN